MAYEVNWFTTTGGGPALSVGATAWHSSGNTSTGDTITVAPTNGSSLLLALGIYSTTTTVVTSVVDNNATALVKDAELVGAGNNQIHIFRLQTASSTTSVTITLDSSKYWVANIIEVIGLASSPIDQISGSTNTNSWSTPSVTTTYANDILIAYGYNSSATTFTATSPAMMGDQYDAPGSQANFIAYQIVSSTGTYSLSGTGATSPNSIVAYKGN